MQTLQLIILVELMSFVWWQRVYFSSEGLQNSLSVESLLDKIVKWNIMKGHTYGKLPGNTGVSLKKH